MVNEYGGERIVANVPWPEAATGKLWLHPGKGNGTFGDRVRPRRARRPDADRHRLVTRDPTH
ncbi:hypothetical protein ACFYN0_25635 [Streptomyces sp. NPDC006704]|uniref:hypothetical protein n=1 Tax=Streptomyces sp. NPDC006704 TaxID=3364760 RepID=UPI00369ABA34